MGRRERMRHPERFQGSLKRQEYFEGWYFKQVSQEDDFPLALIPGVSLSPGDRHAFVQVISGRGHETQYFRYPLEAFSCMGDAFRIAIGPNTFSTEGVTVDLISDSMALKGQLSYDAIQPLMGEPIMGPFSALHFLECYHGVVSMGHEVNGTLVFNGRPIRFAKSRGYIEKDWGISFPKRYIWIQANHFMEEKTSLMFSLADIPMKLFTFRGFLCNLQHQGKEYRFATYNRSKIHHLQPYGGGLYIQLIKGEFSLEIWAKNSQTGQLRAPDRGGMSGRIHEGLGSRVRFQLSHSGRVICEETSGYGGFERFRDQKFLESWRRK